MPTLNCDSNYNKIIAQTLFLGASVSNFNISKGWGGQASQLTVNLIDDKTVPSCVVNAVRDAYGNVVSGDIIKQFPPPTALSVAVDTLAGLSLDPTGKPINHYHDCVGITGCYVDTEGNTATTGTDPTTGKEATKAEDIMVPGKVFYEFIPGYKEPSGIFSKYWVDSDPGFFGKPNRIDINGNLITAYQKDNTNLTKGYDIINTPVYFKMGDFAFGGIVQSWSNSLNSGGESYTVIINGFESVLANCYIILDNFAGAIYSKSDDANADNTFAGPRNYVGREAVNYYDVISNGNIPNVFNVYGFLESLGKGGFGTANSTQDGISANKIIDAVSVLTSSIKDSGDNTVSLFTNTNSSSDSYKDFGPKSAFSPFGRILVKTMQEFETYTSIKTTFTKFGVIPPTLTYVNSGNNAATDNYCQFLLDLSELSNLNLPDDFRISGPVISILDLINQVTEESGHDYHISLYPIYRNSVLLNVIKIHAISRLKQPKTNAIENTIKLMQCQGYNISSAQIGKERNETHARQMIIGGKQQRLYQAKSLRLAYSQNTYIFNPATYQFIDFMRMGSWQPDSSRTRKAGTGVSDPYHHGKIKFPSFLSTRNLDLSAVINPNYSGFYQYQNDIQNRISTISGTFTSADNKWSDSTNLGSNQVSMIQGNYGTAQVVKQSGIPIDWGNAQGERFFPIYMDVISPFFGFAMEEEITIDTSSSSNNDFKKIRPVFLDTWTGQLVIVLRLKELPITSVDLDGFYTARGVSHFTLTENEIRAAIAGFDNFLVYSLSKTYKNDIIEMVRRAFEKKKYDEYIRLGISATDAKELAYESTDWYWKLTNGNIAGPFGQVIDDAPDKGDGSATIDPEAIKDLQIIHSFITEIAKYYGKKYMVQAPALRSYRDDKFADIVLPTQVGDAFVFSGGGDLHYNYEPTNDGAWEEYGNIIDDTISVGSKYWYNITDDVGKIKPIVGYNVSDNFDYIRYNICKLTKAKADDYKTAKNDPYWSYSNYEYMTNVRDSTCNRGNFLLPSVEISSLNTTDYVMVEVSGAPDYKQLPNMYNQWLVAATGGTVTPFAPFSYPGFTKTTAKDAYGSGLIDASGNAIPMKKLYAITSLDEKFIYLDPAKLYGPRILIDAPGLTLASSNSEYAKDPNRTVIANIAIEDLSIYLYSVDPNKWDYEWIKFMLFYTSPIAGPGNDSEMVGNYAASANQSANFVELSPKAAHPFFAGIPIKSNQLSYGPWTNYPYRQYDKIFTSGDNITQSEGIPPSCLGVPSIVDQSHAKLAIDNWILPTNVQVMDDFVPWNYGGMVFLDAAADNEIEKNLNYQSVIETAQIDIPKLPIFSLGGAFTTGMLDAASPMTGTKAIKYIDYKDDDTFSRILNIIPITSGTIIPQFPTEISTNLTYNVFVLSGLSNYTDGPIISNIQSSMGQGGITTTYHFRTYTQKLGLFNKQNNDKLKKLGTEGFKRNKKIASIQQQASNITNVQNKFLQEKRFENASLSGKDLSSKLFGWSPSTVLVGQANPYIKFLDTVTPYFEPSGLYSHVTGINTVTITNSGYIWVSGLDRGTTYDSFNTNFFTTGLSSVGLGNTIRYKTSVGLYEQKEVESQIENDHGLQSIMSFDGIFSPVSFYPTLKNSTYNYTLYDYDTCPFCSGTKKINTEFSFRLATGWSVKQTGIKLFCDKCGRVGESPTSKLKSTVTTSASTQSIETLPPYIITSGTDITALDFLSTKQTSSLTTTTATNSTSSNASAGVSIPINLVTLNPILISDGRLLNKNAQNYTGIHPDGSGIHGDLSFGIYSSSAQRTFYDRCRHSIEIVGRGAVKPKNLNIHNNIDNYINRKLKDTPAHNPDFHKNDLILMKKIKQKENRDVVYQMNQRFMGLRGPLVMHGWGYDLQGYPVPNAADEPYQVDNYGRPRRFKLKIKDGYPKNTKYKSIDIGSIFTVSSNIGNLTAGVEYEKDGSQLSDDDAINHYIYEDDLENSGGFISDTDYSGDRRTGYQGSIISKTQRWKKVSNGQYYDPPPAPVANVKFKWTDKQKLKQFYLNWGERTDLWPVGPVDLRWDENRRVWTMKSSDAASIYKMVYVTLEEDLVRDASMDETYPARGFLDDFEYSTEPLDAGLRRLVFVKDKGGYSAPRGAKLLCRYDKNSGYYEPVSKQTFSAKGTILSGTNQAILELTFIPGNKRGEAVPTLLVNFDNPLMFSNSSGVGIFNYMNGKWTLITRQ